LCSLKKAGNALKFMAEKVRNLEKSKAALDDENMQLNSAMNSLKRMLQKHEEVANYPASLVPNYLRADGSSCCVEFSTRRQTN